MLMPLPIFEAPIEEMVRIPKTNKRRHDFLSWILTKVSALFEIHLCAHQMIIRLSSHKGSVYCLEEF
jgi:hypothetical protein